jgi:hypothetical protein
MNVFSSPLNPEMFAQLAAAGVLGSGPGASSSVPSSNPPPPCPRSSFPSLDTRDSRQDHSPFASPSHPYQRPEHISPSVPPTNGTSHNGLPNRKHFTHGGDINTHSRQGSTGKSFIIKKEKRHRFLTTELTRISRLVNVPSAFLHVFWLRL